MNSSIIRLLSGICRGLRTCLTLAITPLVRAWAISATLPRF